MMYLRGTGMTRFDVDRRASFERLHDCTAEALEMAGASMEDVDAIVASNNEMSTNGERQRHTGPLLSSLFKKQIPIITLPAGCGGGGAAMWNALRMLKEEHSYRNILVLGFEQLVTMTQPVVTDEMLMGGQRWFEQAEGLIFPAQNALVAQQYMSRFGATEDDLALVAHKNHENAYLNEKARFYGQRVPLEKIKSSPVVASPLRLFDCSIPCNGAAAALVSTEKADIEIAGSGLSTNRLSCFESADMTSWQSTRSAAKTAYEQAGLSAGDIDIAEIHDAFTPVELISYEDLGFAQKGKGADLIRSGEVNLNGRLPINTSGGLKAKGHPLSATGVSQIHELMLQLTGEAGKRQIDNVKTGLAQNIGGAGSITAVHILRKAS